MPIGDITGIRKKTLNISNKFFNDIKEFTPGKANYELQLYPRVQKFFSEMNKLDKKEFARYLAQQQYTCNINSNNRDDKNRNQDVFRCLVALIICNHSESDIVRYFFPKNFREKVGSPTYASDSWRIAYWCQALGYWFSQLFGKREYQISSLIEADTRETIHRALQYVCNTMEYNNYIRLIKSDKENLFCQYLDLVTECILRTKNPIPIFIAGGVNIANPSMFTIANQALNQAESEATRSEEPSSRNVRL